MDAALHVRCRDLKSGNLLVDHEGCVKVADFGLSRLYHGMHTMTGGLGTFQVGRSGHQQDVRWFGSLGCWCTMSLLVASSIIC